ncbi:hypothetical protein OKW49_001889 [Paraburkholderia youngii]
MHDVIRKRIGLFQVRERHVAASVLAQSDRLAVLRAKPLSAQAIQMQIREAPRGRQPRFRGVRESHNSCARQQACAARGAAKFSWKIETRSDYQDNPSCTYSGDPRHAGLSKRAAREETPPSPRDNSAYHRHPPTGVLPALPRPLPAAEEWVQPSSIGRRVCLAAQLTAQCRHPSPRLKDGSSAKAVTGTALFLRQ